MASLLTFQERNENIEIRERKGGLPSQSKLTTRRQAFKDLTNQKVEGKAFSSKVPTNQNIKKLTNKDPIVRILPNTLSKFQNSDSHPAGTVRVVTVQPNTFSCEYNPIQANDSVKSNDKDECSFDFDISEFFCTRSSSSLKNSDKTPTLDWSDMKWDEAGEKKCMDHVNNGIISILPGTDIPCSELSPYTIEPPELTTFHSNVENEKIPRKETEKLVSSLSHTTHSAALTRVRPQRLPYSPPSEQRSIVTAEQFEI